MISVEVTYGSKSKEQVRSFLVSTTIFEAAVHTVNQRLRELKLKNARITSMWLDDRQPKMEVLQCAE